MTREQVLAMTDEQLRIKAAELMGWERSTGKMAELLPWKDPQGVSRLDLPDYPNDIAAAWELHTSKISYRGCCGTDFRDRNKYLKALEVAMREEQDVFMSWPYVMALLTPRAITRAFILAMEGDDES